MEISFLMGRKKKTVALVSNEFTDGQCFQKCYYVTASIISLPSDIQPPQLQGVSKQQTGNEKGATMHRRQGFTGPPGGARGDQGETARLEQMCVLSAL